MHGARDAHKEGDGIAARGKRHPWARPFRIVPAGRRLADERADEPGAQSQEPAQHAKPHLRADDARINGAGGIGRGMLARGGVQDHGPKYCVL